MLNQKELDIINTWMEGFHVYKSQLHTRKITGESFMLEIINMNKRIRSYNDIYSYPFINILLNFCTDVYSTMNVANVFQRFIQEEVREDNILPEEIKEAIETIEGFLDDISS